MINKFSSTIEILDFMNAPTDTCVYDPTQIPSCIESGKIFAYANFRDTGGRLTVSSFSLEVGNGADNAQNIHNENGPAYVCFEPEGTSTICYYINNILHRFGEPALIKYSQDGKIIEEMYYMDGVLHNSTGPAYRFYDYGAWRNNFYIRGASVTREQFFANNQIREKYENIHNYTGI